MKNLIKSISFAFLLGCNYVCIAQGNSPSESNSGSMTQTNSNFLEAFQNVTLVMWILMFLIGVIGAWLSAKGLFMLWLRAKGPLKAVRLAMWVALLPFFLIFFGGSFLVGLSADSVTKPFADKANMGSTELDSNKSKDISASGQPNSTAGNSSGGNNNDSSGF